MVLLYGLYFYEHYLECKGRTDEEDNERA